MDAIERVNPIRLTDKDTGRQYELDFSRESVVFAEQRQFDPGDVAKYPQSKVPEFWYYAFRKNHKGMTRTQTDALLDKLGGLTAKMGERLMLLYAQAQASNAIQTDEDLEKNSSMTVEMDD